MFKKDSLFDVIQSLNQEEVKNFYKSLNSKASGDSSYLVLFELVRKCKKFDEKEVADSFFKKTGVKNYHKTKEYLTDLILKSLSLNPNDDNEYYEILAKLYLSELFFNKGLLGLSEVILMRAKKTISDSEFYDQNDRVFHIMARLYRKGSMPHSKAYSYIQEYEESAKKISNIRKYRVLEVKFYFSIKKIHESGDLESIKDFLESPLLSDQKQATTLTSLIIFHNIFRYYYSLTKEYDLLFENSKAIVDLYNQNPIFKGYHTKHFLRSLANLGEASLLVNQHKLFHEINAIYEKHEGKIKNSPSAILVYKYHSKFLKHRQEAKYKEGFALIEEFNNALEKNQIKMFEELELSLILNILIFAFANKEFKFMIKYLNRMAELVEKPEFQKYYYLHKLIDLLKSFEQNDFELCESRIRGIKRMMQTNEMPKDLELVFNTIVFVVFEMKKAIPELEKIKIQYKTLNSELNTIKQYTDLEDFPFRNWTYAKANGISLLELEATIL